MREALRGALLSVMFFALLIGGAPGMAAAGVQSAVSASHVSPDFCDDSGGRWIGSTRDGYCQSRSEWAEECKEIQKIRDIDNAAVAGGAILFVIPEPTTSGVGLLGILFGGAGTIYNTIRYYNNGCDDLAFSG